MAQSIYSNLPQDKIRKVKETKGKVLTVYVVLEHYRVSIEDCSLFK